MIPWNNYLSSDLSKATPESAQIVAATVHEPNGLFLKGLEFLKEIMWVRSNLQGSCEPGRRIAGHVYF